MTWLRPSNLLLPAALVAVSLLAACGNNGCEENRESYCMAELRSRSGATITQLSGWGIGQRRGIDHDSLPADQVMFEETNPSSFELILNPDTTVTRIRLQMTATYYGETDQYCDTLTLRYTAAPHFIDMECGCTVYFTLQEATCTSHLLRNVSIHQNTVTNEENVNLSLEY